MTSKLTFQRKKKKYCTSVWSKDKNYLQNIYNMKMTMNLSIKMTAKIKLLRTYPF